MMMMMMMMDDDVMKVVYKPVFLGGLTTAASNSYLSNMAECPSKAAYQFMDLERRTAK